MRVPAAGVAARRVEAHDEEDHGADARDAAQHDGDDGHLEEVPLLRAAVRDDLVVRDGDDGAVVEDGDDDQRDNGQRERPRVRQLQRVQHRLDVRVRRARAGHDVALGLHGQHREEEEEQQLDGAGDAVDAVVAHALEDLARALDGLDDDRQARLREHDVGGGLGGVRRALDGDADVGALERRRVVDAVARHARHVALLADDVDDLELVLGQHLGEAVGGHDDGGQVAVHAALVVQHLRVEDVGAHAELAARLLGDGRLVARDHLHLHAHVHGRLDRALGVVARRVEEREHALELPARRLVLTRVADRDAERAEAAVGERLHRALDAAADLVLVVRQAQHHLRRALGDLEDLAIGGLDERLRALVRGVERRELDLLERRQLGARRDGLRDAVVDGVLVALRALGGERGVEDDLLLGHVAHEQRLAQAQLVLRERARLVGADHGGGAHRLARVEVLDQVVVGQHAVSAEGQRDGDGERQALGHGHHEDGDAGDDEGQHLGRVLVLELLVVAARPRLAEEPDVHDHDAHERHHAAGLADVHRQLVELRAQDRAARELLLAALLHLRRRLGGGRLAR
mmetsp:Transcript_17772/g.62669  ORF Transcript_17772/g.62669 Transcript_17772/m.62669 type:complete len:574 (+) Transcript_17772:928-2649(+)